MGNLRPTFSFAMDVEHRLKSTAALLGLSENTLRNTLAEGGIEVKRANQDNPNAPAVRIFDIPKIFEIAQYRRAKKLSKGKEGKKPVVIAVALIKGGTGKSTTACEIGIQLQLAGMRVLLCDLDIQSNLSQIMGYESDLGLDEAQLFGLSNEAIVTGTFATICSPLLERKARPVDARSVLKFPFGPSGPALIPSDTFFGDLENLITMSTGPRELVFQRFFGESIAGRVLGLNVSDYDVVILDCAPNVSFVATNAIASADLIVAPVKMDSFSVKGLSRLVSEINLLTESYPSSVTNPQLVIIPTFYSTNLPRVSRMQGKLAKYRDFTSPYSISQSEEFPKSIEKYLPLTLLKPMCTPVKEYRMFVDYLIKKISAISKAKGVGK